jgi:hypothetical protein
VHIPVTVKVAGWVEVALSIDAASDVITSAFVLIEVVVGVALVVVAVALVVVAVAVVVILLVAVETAVVGEAVLAAPVVIVTVQSPSQLNSYNGF